MAYHLQYGVSRFDKRGRGAPWRKWLTLLLVAIFLLGGWLLPQWGIALEWLLPGDPKVTAFALENLRAGLASGEPLGEALAAFCREVIHGAVPA